MNNPTSNKRRSTVTIGLSESIDNHLKIVRMSNKDLLKLENEYRNDIPRYKEKPKITATPRPLSLTNRIAAFLADNDKTGDTIKKCVPDDAGQPETAAKANVEMDIFITSM